MAEGRSLLEGMLNEILPNQIIELPELPIVAIPKDFGQLYWFVDYWKEYASTKTGFYSMPTVHRCLAFGFLLIKTRELGQNYIY